MEAIQGEEDGLDDPRERDSRRHEVEELPSPCGPSPCGPRFPIIFRRDFVELRFAADDGSGSTVFAARKISAKSAKAREACESSGNVLRDNGKPEPSGRGARGED